jgi:8-oxo-dGTP pyrophosphatase MutT (NUDIX family)
VNERADSAGAAAIGDFFDRAHERLTLEVPPGLTDPSARGVRGDLDLNPEIWLRAGVKATRPAAVLVPIIDRSEPTVLLTLRTAELASHAGQVAFPGGKIEPADESPVAAALREAREETGLAPALIEPIGYLDLYLTFSGFRILPTVARVKPDFTQSAGGDRDIRSAVEISDDAGQSPAQDARLERFCTRLLRDPLSESLHLGHHRGYSTESL